MTAALRDEDHPTGTITPMTDTTTGPAPTRPGRLPAPARRALRRLEEAYTGDDVTYTRALEHVNRIGASLPPAQRTNFNAALLAASERIRAREFTDQVRTALATGTRRVVRTLPDGIELVEVTSASLHQLLVTLPAAQPGDTPEQHLLVAKARAAILDDSCENCGPVLTATSGSQLAVTHRATCPLGEGALAAARRT